MAYWTSKHGDPKGENCDNPSDVSSESKHREFKHGNFSNNAIVYSAEEQLGTEGSRGHIINQGGHDTAIEIPHDGKGKVGQKVGRIKTNAQGSHAQMGYKDKKVSRERV